MTADTSKRAAGGKDISAARRGEISLDGRVLSSLLCTADVQTNSRRRCPARSEALRDSPPPEAAFGAQDIRTGRRRLVLLPVILAVFITRPHREFAVIISHCLFALAASLA